MFAWPLLRRIRKSTCLLCFIKRPCGEAGYAAGLMSARPLSSSLVLRRCVGLSVTTTSRVGRTCPSPRRRALALPSQVPSTMWMWSVGMPRGSSATSPISAATSTCSRIEIVFVLLVLPVKIIQLRSLNAPIAVNEQREYSRAAQIAGGWK